MKTIKREKPSRQKVFVYYNLTSKVWSVKALTGPHKGLVIAHRENVTLVDVTPRISEAGRQRVLRDRQKNVHAGLVGYWIQDIATEDLPLSTCITYNPYRAPTFTFKADGTPYRGSKFVSMVGRSVRVTTAQPT